jgi:hypothetical protein
MSPSSYPVRFFTQNIRTAASLSRWQTRNRAWMMLKASTVQIQQYRVCAVMCASIVNSLSHRISPVVIPSFLVLWFISEVAVKQREALISCDAFGSPSKWYCLKQCFWLFLVALKEMVTCRLLPQHNVTKKSARQLKTALYPFETWYRLWRNYHIFIRYACDNVQCPK